MLARTAPSHWSGCANRGCSLLQLITKGGTNLSSGQRQLFCFARAILGRALILVLDEATSNLDDASDAKIQARIFCGMHTARGRQAHAQAHPHAMLTRMAPTCCPTSTTQALLRTEFARFTVLTIAHRLLTVIDYDEILVMGAGRLLEQGPPAHLLSNPGSMLSSMAKALGDKGEAALVERANAAM